MPKPGLHGSCSHEFVHTIKTRKIEGSNLVFARYDGGGITLAKSSDGPV